MKTEFNTFFEIDTWKHLKNNLNMDSKIKSEIMNLIHQKYQTAIQNQTKIVNFVQLKKYLLTLLQNKVTNDTKMEDHNRQKQFQVLTNLINELINSDIKHNWNNYMYNIKNVEKELFQENPQYINTHKIIQVVKYNDIIEIVNKLQKARYDHNQRIFNENLVLNYLNDFYKEYSQLDNQNPLIDVNISEFVIKNLKPLETFQNRTPSTLNDLIDSQKSNQYINQLCTLNDAIDNIYQNLIDDPRWDKSKTFNDVRHIILKIFNSCNIYTINQLINKHNHERFQVSNQKINSYEFLLDHTSNQIFNQVLNNYQDVLIIGNNPKKATFANYFKIYIELIKY